MTRSKLMVGLSACLVLCLVAIAASALWAQPAGGGQGPGGRGGMQQMMYIDRCWTAVSFGVEATPDQITKLTPAFKSAWDTRVEAIKKVQAAQDRQAAMQEAIQTMQQVKTDLDAKLKEVLTPEQMTTLQTFLGMGQGGRRNRAGQQPQQ